MYSFFLDIEIIIEECQTKKILFALAAAEKLMPSAADLTIGVN